MSVEEVLVFVCSVKVRRRVQAGTVDGRAREKQPQKRHKQNIAHDLQTVALVQLVQAKRPICHVTNVLLLSSAAHYCVLSPYEVYW